MASMYTTARGKNKKAKTAIRKDAANNASTKLMAKMASAPVSEPVLARHHEPSIVGSKRGAAERLRLRLEEGSVTTGGAGGEDAAVGGGSGAVSAEGIATGAEACVASRAGCGNTACVATAPVLRACVRCKTQRYCGAACQKADWPLHKASCKAGGGAPAVVAGAGAEDAGASAEA